MRSFQKFVANFYGAGVYMDVKGELRAQSETSSTRTYESGGTFADPIPTLFASGIEAPS